MSDPGARTDPAAVIDVAELTVVRGGHTALDRLDLRVAAGESVLLTGDSGSGKSTLLGVLDGLVPHLQPAELSGRVRVAGIEPAAVDLDEAGRVTATVFQNPRTQSFATDVLSELAFGAANRRVPRAEILDRVDRAAATFGLTSLLGRRMTELSGGQRQRVALAAAVVGRPEVVLLDEPTANLDDEGAAAVAAALRVLREQGTTVLVAEHRLHHLSGVVDRVVRIDGGRVVDDRSAESFWAMGDAERRRAGLRRLTEPVREPLPAPPSGPATGGAADSPHGAHGGVSPSGLTLRGLRFPPTGPPLWEIDRAELGRGTVTCVTGPNGCGKSTLLSVLVGLRRAGGQVCIDGVPVRPHARRRHCAVVLQDVGRQLLGASVAEELALGRHPADPGTTLADLGLAGLEDRHPLSLCGGQRQRLAVATAVLAGADAVLFDEPTSGLDLRSMHRMAAVIRGCADRGVAVVVATHDRELVEAVGERELVLGPPRAGPVRD